MISIIETNTKIIMHKKITLSTPILVMSLAAPTKFKASLNLPLCANLASAINWKNEKTKNIIRPAEMVIDMEINKGSDALNSAASAAAEFPIRILGIAENIPSPKDKTPPIMFVISAINTTILLIK